MNASVVCGFVIKTQTINTLTWSSSREKLKIDKSVMFLELEKILKQASLLLKLQGLK